MAMLVNKPIDALVKPLTKFVMYLEEWLLSVKTCKALFEKMKCLHLCIPFSEMPCVVFSCGTYVYTLDITGKKN
jgi:hypothetical protein